MTTQAVSNAVALRENGPSTIIEEYGSELALVMPSHVKPELWVQVAIGAVNRDEKLVKAARNNPAALMSALMEAARKGLEPGTEQYYLTPRWNGKKKCEEIKGMTGYQGEVEMIYRAGAVSSVIIEVVREDDLNGGRFLWAPGKIDTQNPPRWRGEMTRPFHEPNWFGNRGELIGVYAYAVMKDGAISEVVMLNREEVMEAKAQNKDSDGEHSPWQKWEKAMWLKTAAHRLAKWVPTSAEYRREELRAQADVAAERRGASFQGAPFNPAPAQPQRPAEGWDAAIGAAATIDDLGALLREARALGDAVAAPPTELGGRSGARRTAFMAAEASADNGVVYGHAHDTAYDADCDGCKAEQAEADRKLAAAAA